MYRAFLVVIAVVVHGSLYPWSFHSAPLPGSPLWVLIHSWPTGIDRFLIRDIAINILIYVPIGVFGFLAFRQNAGVATSVVATLFVGLVMSSSIEMIQLFDDARECSASDVLCNVSGTAVGVGLGSLYRRWLEQVLARPETATLLHPSGTVLLVYTWFAYQVFPLFPVTGRARLAAKFHSLLSERSFSPLDVLTYGVEWLALALFLAAVLGPGKTRRWLPLLLLGLLAKPLIAGRTVTWAELTGAAAACLCSYLLSGYGRRPALVAILMLSVLILQGLAPFHWTNVATRFSWMPFSGFLAADREFAALIFLRKCFWYGSTVSLLRAAGWGLAKSAAVVTLVLGIIEAIQTHLPGRVAEITDPLLALLLAAVLGLSEHLRIRESPQPTS